VETLVKKLSGGMTRIKPSQIKKIYKRFNDIDVDKSGAIDYKEFLMALEIDDSKTSKQMFNVFDMDGSNSIELKEFIVVLSRYTSAAKDEKLRFAFMMFDEDGSGYIERDELINMLRANFVIEGFSDMQLEQKADNVFKVLDLPVDGKISYEEFMRLHKDADGLIYPITNEERRLKEEQSINAMIKEASSF
jgi:serine/threonine-protein phosphatase 2B regulatory subunit